MSMIKFTIFKRKTFPAPQIMR